jgi:hypothetical protein
LIKVKAGMTQRIETLAFRWRTPMSTFEILYLLGAIFAFVTLAAFLAWDEYCARHSAR